MSEFFKWSLVALSLAGVVLNIRRRRECFWIWCFTNAAWSVIDMAYGIWSQAALQAVYFFLAVWGLMAWRSKAE